MSSTPPREPLTAAKARVVFYDVEALPNVFTVAAFDPIAECLHLFHLVDGALGEMFVLEGPASVERIVRRANPALPKNVRLVLHDLHDYSANRTLALMLGMFAGEKVTSATPCTSVPPMDGPSLEPLDQQYRPVCDTDPSYDPMQHPLLGGYNSRRYDTTILALYLVEAFGATRADLEANAEDRQNAIEDKIAMPAPRKPRFVPTTAACMFNHNSMLFSEEFRANMPGYLVGPARAIRKAMLDSGRHIDIDAFNEGTMISLKRVLAGMGRQILEFETFQKAVATTCDLRDLIAYNVSDVVGLAAVFEHPNYAATFDLKAGLLATYPECVYSFGKPHTPDNVRDWRLTLDTTAAQLAARILAPGKALTDLPTVSFLYPEEKIAEELGIEQRNILNDTINWFVTELGFPWTAPTNGATTMELGAALKYAPAPIAEAIRKVTNALKYYSRLEGINVNDSSRYYGKVEFTDLYEVAKTPNNIPYFRLDGSPTSGYANFSIGGIHGAEFDLEAWRLDAQALQNRNADRRAVQQLYPDALDLWLALPGKRTIEVNGNEWTRDKLLTAVTRKKDLLARREEILALGDDPSEDDLAAIEERWAGIGYRPLEPDLPMFKPTTDGANRLDAKYGRTSAGLAIHEDFTSYYPNLLRNMAAFRNPELGEDRYAAIFEQKEDLGRQMKKPGIDSLEKARLGVLREGTKLVLNSASGAADASRDTQIRMNNRILSMRIIGQLLTWRIGQAQTFAGATVVSTNTDGLYTMGLDAETNNRVLAEQAEMIHIGIEPEPVLLVSKDSNNRIEFKVDQDVSNAEVISASGGSLAAVKGPTPKKSLAHPAVLDWALARYLREILAGNASIDADFDRVLGKQLIDKAAALDPFEACRLFQHILVASPAKRIIPFGTDCRTGQTVLLAHTSRIFFVLPDDEDEGLQRITLRAATSSTTQLEDVLLQRELLEVLKVNGWSRYGEDGTTVLPSGHHPNVRKVTGIGSDWPVIVANHDLLIPPAGSLTPEQILQRLDLERYLDMLAETFEANWRNGSAQKVAEDADDASDSEDDDPASPADAA